MDEITERNPTLIGNLTSTDDIIKDKLFSRPSQIMWLRLADEITEKITVLVSNSIACRPFFQVTATLGCAPTGGQTYK